MTKSCLFVPVIDIMMIRNAPKQASIIKIELMILKRKCDCKVAIFNGSASSTYLPWGIRMETRHPKKTIHFFYVIINKVEVLSIYQSTRTSQWPFTATSVAIVLFGWLESMADSPGMRILNYHIKKTNLFLWVVEIYGTKNISESDSGSISDGYLFVER